MDAPATASSHDRPRVGRPPRISRQMIAEAAHEVGLEGLTLRAVADRLDVSIAALYHHVSGKDELLRLAAEQSASRLPLPRDRGQHWAIWLYEWAAYNRDAFVSEPALLGQYLDGAITSESIARRVDGVLDLLVRQGFSIVDASAAYDLVSSLGLGMAVTTLRARRDADTGADPRLVGGIAAGADAGDLPRVRELAAAVAGEDDDDPFRSHVTTVLAGLAARRGEDWRAIVRLLADVAGDEADDV